MFLIHCDSMVAACCLEVRNTIIVTGGMLPWSWREGSSCNDHSTNGTMEQLHWLLIEWQIRFKLATLTYKALHIGRAPYLADLLQLHTTPKSMHSSSSQLPFVPRHNLSFGSRSFCISAPYLFTLGNHNHSPHSDAVWRHTLLPVSLSCHLASIHQRALILFIQTLALYKSFTYLLSVSDLSWHH